MAYIRDSIMHVSVDTETMGVGNDAPVIAIGMCVFDPFACTIGARFERVADFEAACEQGVMEPATVKWWLGQSDEARKQLLRGNMSPHQCAHDVNFWLREQASGREILLYSNGPDFDHTKLNSMYKRLGIKPAWGYTAPRDFRTFRTIGALSFDMEIPKGTTTGVYHRALDDAVFQAEHIVRVWNAINVSGINGA